jgi:hypothetical protein
MKGFNEGFVYRGRLVMCGCGHAKKDHVFNDKEPYVKCNLSKCTCYSDRKQDHEPKIKFKLHVHNGIAHWIKTTED